MNRKNCFMLNSTHTNQPQSEEINVEVKELILTPLTCASLINEIIKCLLYQKSQIPYPYIWLNSVVNRRRSDNETKPINLTVEQHYRVVSTAYNALKDLTSNISTEFQHSNDIQQVLILFGSTVYSPKEVFRIKIAGVARGHSEDNHSRINTKNQHKVLRHVVLAQQWMRAMETSIPPTNMHVLLQKCSKNTSEIDERFFQPILQYSVPSRVKTTVIKFDYSENTVYNCCDNLSIYEDFLKDKTEESNASNSTNDTDLELDNPCGNSGCDLTWFQAKVALKGFKECFVNNVSATELW